LCVASSTDGKVLLPSFHVSVAACVTWVIIMMVILAGHFGDHSWPLRSMWFLTMAAVAAASLFLVLAMVQTTKVGWE